MAVVFTAAAVRLVTALGSAANTAEGYVRLNTTVEKTYYVFVVSFNRSNVSMYDLTCVTECLFHRGFTSWCCYRRHTDIVSSSWLQAPHSRIVRVDVCSVILSHSIVGYNHVCVILLDSLRVGPLHYY